MRRAALGGMVPEAVAICALNIYGHLFEMGLNASIFGSGGGLLASQPRASPAYAECEQARVGYLRLARDCMHPMQPRFARIRASQKVGCALTRTGKVL